MSSTQEMLSFMAIFICRTKSIHLHRQYFFYLLVEREHMLMALTRKMSALLLFQ